MKTKKNTKQPQHTNDENYALALHGTDENSHCEMATGYFTYDEDDFFVCLCLLVFRCFSFHTPTPRLDTARVASILLVFVHTYFHFDGH